MVQARVRLLEGMAFEGLTASGHRIVLDAAPEVGGKDKGARPMELLLVALGSCTAMDVISILRKKRQEVTDYEVIVVGDQTDDHPKVYTSIRVEHVVKGKDVSPEAVRRAVELSEDKYCPIIALLRPGTIIESSFRVTNE